jgi:hypothetical protein
MAAAVTTAADPSVAGRAAEAAVAVAIPTDTVAAAAEAAVAAFSSHSAA